MEKWAFSIVLLGGIVLFTGMAAAAERHVPSEYATIQAAINDCNNGDVVIVAPGTYTGTGNRDIDFIGKAITITSENPDDPNIVTNTIINCNGAWLDGHRGFNFHSGEGINSVLDGFTITNGLAWNENGGGILCQNSSPTISNCIITNNSAEVHMIGGGCGGGISCEESSPNIINCTITNNTCSFNGGGINIFYGAPTVSNCIVSNNVSNGGGGIACQADSAVITNCVITNNEAIEGAGLGCVGGSNALIYNCTIRENFGIQENTRGGGIACTESSPTISKCLIAGCSADYGGGGIYCADNSSPAISNCTIVYNYVGGGGTGVYGRGGGIYCYWSDPNITDSILWANTADWAGPQIALRAGSSWPSTLTVSCCNIQGGQADAYVEEGCSLLWLTGNIVSDPCFSDPYSDDYHLKSAAGRWDPNSQSWVTDAVTSPCIDAGNPGCPLGDEPNDANNVRINMGAYGGTAEASKTPADWRNIADLTNDWVVDFNDLGVFVSYWLDTGECIPSDLNRNQAVNFVDYAIFAQQWLDALP
jgi:parallel beta-helix repeat protein